MYVHLIFYMETPSVRVLVVGDSGVGKTTLLRSICRLYSRDSIDYDKPSSLWTTGCDVHVLLKIFEPEGQEIFVEFLDIGGHRKYELSRGTFYHNIHGIMFVHDLSNTKSGQHLRNWSKEIHTMQKLKGCVVPPTGNSDDIPTLQKIPKLVVGNKKDLRSQSSMGLIGPTEFHTVATIESSANPLSMVPSGVFEAFLYQTVAFANRDTNSKSSSGGQRLVHINDDNTTTGVSNIRSRWW
ncbi:putative small GTPase, sigma-54 interaction domain, ATP-binding site 1 [Plasmopara halstedii]